MTLSALIRKGGLAKVATATPATLATLATQETENAGTVAVVATVAVVSPPASVSAITAEEETVIRDLAGADWPEIEADPVLMGTFTRAVQVRRIREQGKVPEHYTAMTLCSGCGPVPIFPGASELVDACPWCFNRIAGRPIPRT